MATSGFRPYGEDENVKGPMEYVSETEECICGWCGQLLIPNHNNQTPEAHFKDCKNSKDNGKVFKELRLVQKNVTVLNEKLNSVKTEVMEEVKAGHILLKTELNNEIVALKEEIKVELETLKKVVENEEDFIAFNNKVQILEDGMEKKMREMGVAQDMKMAEMSGKFSGVTETITTVVHSVLEGVRRKKVTSSADTSELAPLKRDMETLSEQVKSNGRDLQVLKRQVENEGATDDASKRKKKKRFHVEPSPSEQLTIPMNCFNLAAHNHLFQPSYTWIIDGIEAQLSRGTFEMSSDLFQWNGYPIHARAKLQLKKDGYVYISLRLKDALQGKSHLRDITPIPQVYYLLKHNSPRQTRHKCSPTCYFLGSRLNSSLAFQSCFIHQSWLDLSTYKVNDSVEFEIYVEAPAMTQHVHSYDGTLDWKMENYKRRLRLEKKGLVCSQESPYFYTSVCGYRVRVEMYLTGVEGKGLTARILFVTGKFDAPLPDSYPHSTTVTLINRKDSQRSISKTITSNIIHKIYHDLEMCKLEEVENFIENDTLFCKVSIESQ